MNSHHSHHTARYDAEGNIILPGSIEPEQKPKIESDVWHTISEDGETISAHDVSGQVMKEPVHQPVRHIKHSTHGFVEATILEGERQLIATEVGALGAMQSFVTSLRTAPQKVTGSVDKAIEFAAAPVLPDRIPKKKKPHSRATLFAFDTVRFGGTFALIFGILFVGINFSSFWDIAKAQLALGDDIQTTEALSQLIGQNGNEGTANQVNTVSEDSSFFSYLPPVGPPEDRLIIPKLGKNIPIQDPPIDALMNQDWKKFEEDVQESLRHGVVHYPGTARPGQAGNFFITGHSSYYPWDAGHYKDVFARLHELEPGDTYSVYYGGDLHMYKVVRTFEVKPTDVSVLDQPSNKRLATLMTCTPIGTTLRRLIVQAEEIDPVTHKPLAVGERMEEFKPAKLDMLPI